jgi:CHAT domain-containing protein
MGRELTAAAALTTTDNMPHPAYWAPFSLMGDADAARP